MVVVGHSLGGALAVRLAATGRVANLKGVVVIDVVEGTALGTVGGYVVWCGLKQVTLAVELSMDYKAYGMGGTMARGMQ